MARFRTLSVDNISFKTCKEYELTSVARRRGGTNGYSSNKSKFARDWGCTSEDANRRTFLNGSAGLNCTDDETDSSIASADFESSASSPAVDLDRWAHKSTTCFTNLSNAIWRGQGHNHFYNSRPAIPGPRESRLGTVRICCHFATCTIFYVGSCNYLYTYSKLEIRLFCLLNQNV